MENSSQIIHKPSGIQYENNITQPMSHLFAPVALQNHGGIVNSPAQTNMNENPHPFMPYTCPQTWGPTNQTLQTKTDSGDKDKSQAKLFLHKILSERNKHNIQSEAERKFSGSTISQACASDITTNYPKPVVDLESPETLEYLNCAPFSNMQIDLNSEDMGQVQWQRPNSYFSYLEESPVSNEKTENEDRSLLEIQASNDVHPLTL